MSEEPESGNGRRQVLYVSVVPEPNSDDGEHGLTETVYQLDGGPFQQSFMLSLEEVSDVERLFSVKSLELLQSIREHEPTSMRELARLSERDVSQVSRTLNRLADLGVVSFEQTGRSKRPVVSFNRIEFAFGLDDSDFAAKQPFDRPPTEIQSEESESHIPSVKDIETSGSDEGHEGDGATKAPQSRSEIREYFEQVEFPSGETGDNFIHTMHDPRMLYDFVHVLHEHVESGFAKSATFDVNSEIDSDERRVNAEIYTKAEILRGTMQYVEEFGLYLAAYLRDDRSLAQNLIEGKASKFYEAFEHANRSPDQFLAQHGVDARYEDRLRTVFGYERLLSSLAESDAKGNRSQQSKPQDTIPESTTEDQDSEAENRQILSEDEIEVAIDASIEVLHSQIESIAEFYLEFRDLYNAIKHGTRITSQNGLTIETEIADEPIMLDEHYVSALCKTSGDVGGNRPYFLQYPADLLVSRSLFILERTGNLFEYLRDQNEAQRPDESEPIDGSIRFLAFDARVEDDETLQRILASNADSQTEAEARSAIERTAVESKDYIQVGNANSKTFIPRSKAFEAPTPSAVAARCSLSGNTMVIETRLDREPSQQYPIAITFRPSLGNSARLSLLGHLSIRSEFDCLDFVQQEELLRIMDGMSEDRIKYVEFDVTSSETTIREPLENDWTVDVPQAGFDRESIAFLANLEKATQRRLPVPSMLFEEHQHILRTERGPIGSRVDAQSTVKRLEESLAGTEITHVFVEHNGEVSHLTDMPGTITPRFTTEDGRESSLKDLLGEDQGSFTIRFDGIPGTPDWFIEQLRANPEFVDDVLRGTSVPGEEGSGQEFAVVNEFQLHRQTFWYDESRITIRAESTGPRKSDAEGERSQ